MATFTAENRQAWQNIADDASLQRPSVGKTVRVTGGKKHRGKTGRVMWHGKDQYYSTQYKSDAMLALMEINGRAGYRVRIQPDQGEAFFISAEQVEVI